MTKPKVTIGICARNCAKIVSDTFRSVSAQTYPHDLMEIVFVDDGSEDDTAQVIQRYADKVDIRSRIIRTEWRGLGSARNTVVQNANGEYIIWVDCDEELESNYVEIIARTMDQNPKAGIVLGVTSIPEANLAVKLDMIPFFVERMNALQEGCVFDKLPGTGGAAFRTEALRQVGGFDEKIKGAGEDVEVAYRVKSQGWLVTVAPARFYEKKGGILTLHGLMSKYFWYGYGNHKVYMKNRKVIEPAKMTPLAGIVVGISYAVEVYKFTHGKIQFLLLPTSLGLKYIAWMLGFTKSHLQMLRRTM